MSMSQAGGACAEWSGACADGEYISQDNIRGDQPKGDVGEGAQRGGMKQQMQAAGVAQHSSSEYDGGAEWAQVQSDGGQRETAPHSRGVQETQSGLCAGRAPGAPAPGKQAAGYNADRLHSGGERRAHARHEGNVHGNQLGE
ncbi:hypothetical protein K438DRAFT_1772100 [Mycena galopus ATCC 62051]|nr:hypothetical protein K438DRAFT_1772100 [Mycena galopus ATCC 62051]